MSTKKKNELMIDERFDVRPKAKPDEAVKGRLLKWKDSDYVAFEPQRKKDTPPRTVLKEQKGGCRGFDGEGSQHPETLSEGGAQGGCPQLPGRYPGIAGVASEEEGAALCLPDHRQQPAQRADVGTPVPSEFGDKQDH